LRRGLAEPGGKLPLFDRDGQRYSQRTIQSCIDQGWAKPWFHNPIKPDWLICRLTETGKTVVAETSPTPGDRPGSRPASRVAPRMALGPRCDARWQQSLVRDLIEA